MKKVILLLTAITLFTFFSCSEEEEIEIANESPIALSEYLNSNDFASLESNFKDFAKNLDPKTFVEFEENDLTLYSLQSRNNDNIFGNIVFSKTSKGIYVSIVEMYNRDSKGSINSFDYKSVNNENLFSFDSKQIENNTYSLRLNKESLISSNSTQRRSWLTCTGECITDAWGACDDDTECDLICTITGPACPSSIAAACGVWCANDTDNDLTPSNDDSPSPDDGSPSPDDGSPMPDNDSPLPGGGLLN